MAPCTRLLLLVVLVQGCAAGHLLDAARRRERVLTYDAAALDGERLRLRYQALASDDTDVSLGRREREVAIARSRLVAEPWSVVGSSCRARAVAAGSRPAGQPVAIVHSPQPVTSRPSLLVRRVDGRDVAFTLVDGAGPQPGAEFDSGRLTCASIAPWFYALLPFALVADAVVDPVLLFLAPAVLLIGD
jgi:hypothetical protein